AFEDGHDAGVAEGAQQTARTNARNLLRMNLGNPEQIAQAVSLPLEEIFVLQKELSGKDTAQA
ncbi:MAG: hypothetical protein J1E07_09570, partial [Treponema sp.]|nr:hypothetical protein [Treponema sp.]